MSVKTRLRRITSKLNGTNFDGNRAGWNLKKATQKGKETHLWKTTTIFGVPCFGQIIAFHQQTDFADILRDFPTFDQHGSFQGCMRCNPSQVKRPRKKQGLSVLPFQSYFLNFSCQLSRLYVGHHVSSIIGTQFEGTEIFKSFVECLGGWFTTCSSKCVNFFPQSSGWKIQELFENTTKFRQYYGISQFEMLKTEPKRGLVQHPFHIIQLVTLPFGDFFLFTFWPIQLGRQPGNWKFQSHLNIRWILSPLTDYNDYLPWATEYSSPQRS